MDISKPFTDKNLSPFDKMVFVFLRNMAGRKKECWPSYETIMAGCNIVDRSSLCRSVKKLEACGYFKITKKVTSKKRHNLYSFANQVPPNLQSEFLAVEREFCKFGENIRAK